MHHVISTLIDKIEEKEKVKVLEDDIDLDSHELNKTDKEIIHFLEYLAFFSVRKEKIIISFDFLSRIIDFYLKKNVLTCVESNTKKEQCIELINLCMDSNYLIRVNAPKEGGELKYRFAQQQQHKCSAKYIVNLYAKEPFTVHNLIAETKYNPRYEHIWQYVARLLFKYGHKKNDYTLLIQLIKQIKALPRDFIGLREFKLLCLCLNQCSAAYLQQPAQKKWLSEMNKAAKPLFKLAKTQLIYRKALQCVQSLSVLLEPETQTELSAYLNTPVNTTALEEKEMEIEDFQETMKQKGYKKHYLEKCQLFGLSLTVDKKTLCTNSNYSTVSLEVSEQQSNEIVDYFLPEEKESLDQHKVSTNPFDHLDDFKQLVNLTYLLQKALFLFLREIKPFTGKEWDKMAHNSFALTVLQKLVKKKEYKLPLDFSEEDVLPPDVSSFIKKFLLKYSMIKEIYRYPDFFNETIKPALLNDSVESLVLTYWPSSEKKLEENRKKDEELHRKLNPSFTDYLMEYHGINNPDTSLFKVFLSGLFRFRA